MVTIVISSLQRRKGHAECLRPAEREPRFTCRSLGSITEEQPATFFSSWRSPLSPASDRAGEELVMNNAPNKQHWRQDILDILEILHTFLFFVLSAYTEFMPHKRENSSACLRSSQLVTKDGLFLLHHILGLFSSAFALGFFIFNPVLLVTVH